MRPYEHTEQVVVAKGDDIVAIDYPSRVSITRIRITRVNSGAFNVTVYTRAFTGTPVTLAGIVPHVVAGGNDKAVLVFDDRHWLKVGDTVTVASTDVGTYDGTHTVVEVYDDYRVLTATDFTTPDTGGTGVVTVASGQQPNYELIALTAANNSVVRIDEPRGIPFVNQDPPSFYQAQTQKLYFKISVADTFTITVTSISDWHH